MAHSNAKQNFLFSHTRWPKSKKYSQQIHLTIYMNNQTYTHVCFTNKYIFILLSSSVAKFFWACGKSAEISLPE